MTPENFDRVLRAFLTRKPFRPFTIELIGGGRIEVNHPEALTGHGQNLVSCRSTTQARSLFEIDAVVRFYSETGST